MKRYTKPEKLHQLLLNLPDQPPPEIRSPNDTAVETF